MVLCRKCYALNSGGIEKRRNAEQWNSYAENGTADEKHGSAVAQLKKTEGVVYMPEGPEAELMNERLRTREKLEVI